MHSHSALLTPHLVVHSLRAEAVFVSKAYFDSVGLDSYFFKLGVIGK